MVSSQLDVLTEPAGRIEPVLTTLAFHHAFMHALISRQTEEFALRLQAKLAGVRRPGQPRLRVQVLEPSSVGAARLGGAFHFVMLGHREALPAGWRDERESWVLLDD